MATGIDRNVVYPQAPGDIYSKRLHEALVADHDDLSRAINELTDQVKYLLSPSGGDDTSNINIAIDQVEAAGGGTVILSDGIFHTTAPIAIGASKVKIKGQGPHQTTIIPAGAGTFKTFAFDGVIGSPVDLGSNADFGALTITLTGGGGAGFAVGDYILLTDDDAKAQTSQITVKATDVLTLSTPIYSAYTTANGAKIQKLTPLVGVELSDLGIDANLVLGADSIAIWAFSCVESMFANLYVTGATGSGLYIDTGYNNRIQNLTLEDSGSSTQSDLEVRRQGAHQVHDIQSYRAAGFGPQWAFNSGGQASNIVSIAATGRGMKLQRNIRGDFSNIHVHRATMTGLSVTVGSEGNRFTDVFAIGNALAGVWCQGDDGDVFNIFVNLESMWNTSRDIELGAGADDNLFANFRVKLPMDTAILDSGLRNAFNNAIGHNGPGYYKFDSSANPGPEVVLDRGTASPANSDFIGNLIFSGRDNTGEVTQYTRLSGVIRTVTNGSEDGRLDLVALAGGSEHILMQLQGPTNNGEVGFLVEINKSGVFSLQQVVYGAANSAGTGLAALAIANP